MTTHAMGWRGSCRPSPTLWSGPRWTHHRYSCSRKAPCYRMVVLTCGILGLRGCEAYPLERQDCNLKTGLIKVSKSVKPTTRGFVVDPPKNGKVQTVPMGFLQPEFERHLRTMDNIAPEALLFPSPRTGGYIHRDTIRKHVKKVGARMGLDERCAGRCSGPRRAQTPSSTGTLTGPRNCPATLTRG